MDVGVLEGVLDKEGEDVGLLVGVGETGDGEEDIEGVTEGEDEGDLETDGDKETEGVELFDG